MNNEALKLSKSASEHESQASPPEVESLVSGSVPRQRSSSSQPENCNLPSFSSSKNDDGATGNGTDKTSSEDQPESFSVMIIWRRMLAFAANRIVNEPDWALKPRTTGSCQESEEQISDFISENSIISRDLMYKFWDAVSTLFEGEPRHTLAITDREREFLEQFARRFFFEVPVEKLKKWKIPSLDSCALEWALVRILLNELPEENLSRVISGTSIPEASSDLCDSQPSSSEIENEMHSPPEESTEIAGGNADQIIEN